MTLTSRKKRPLDRTIPHLRDTRLIIIATEGEKTEKQYFESYLFRSSRVQVRILETTEGLSAPKHVLKRMRDFAKDFNLQPDDQLWLMIDKDRIRDEHLSGICSESRSVKFNLALSNPCFELWLYLHIDNWSGGNVSSKQIEIDLRDKIGSYNKSNLDIDKYSDGINSAIDRARNMENKKDTRWPSNPGTHVYRVVEEILKIM